MAERESRFNMLLSDHERLLLDRLAEDLGLSASDVLRGLMREAFKARFGEEAFMKEKRRALKIRERDQKGGA